MSSPMLGAAAVEPVAVRRRRRALMRAHHPDLGGDPEVFIRVMGSLDTDPGYGFPGTEVRFVKRRRWRVLVSRPLSFRARRPRRVV